MGMVGLMTVGADSPRGAAGAAGGPRGAAGAVGPRGAAGAAGVHAVDSRRCSSRSWIQE